MGLTQPCHHGCTGRWWIMRTERRADLPGDDEVAAYMRRLAEVFVRGAAAEGRVFAWDNASALRLDELCEQYLASRTDYEARHYFSVAMGAYLGELVVRNGRGRWTWHAVARAPAVVIADGRRCFPLHKVAKRLAFGREHSLAGFFDFMMTCRVAADAKLTPREWNPDALHPNTQAGNNLAAVYQTMGPTAEQIPVFEQTLADAEQALGADHRDTLTARHNLAIAYRAAGRTGEAIALLERTLADSERVLGTDHPDSLASRATLATAYRSAKRAGEAIPLLEQTLAASERVLGPEHLNTLATRNNLAAAYQAAGRTGAAIALLEQTLADAAGVLGADHPNTLTAQNNLAAAYQAAGRTGAAIPLLEQTLADAERVLGANHPNTLTAQNTLAAANRAAGADGRGHRTP
ncbi:MAG: tetratricopeptide repeat protein [Actinobacteria bacterium]|nr:tetratricopeptide repeat protein [Actinomycetota bacterium]